MKRFFVAFLAGLLAGMPVYAGKNDGLAIPGVGSNRNTDVFEVDHDATRVQIQLYELRLGTGSTPDVTPGADDMFIEGTLEVDGATRLDGALTQGGALAANGNVTLGDAATDSLTVNATTFTFSTSWLYFSTATTPGTNVMTLDGTNFRVGVNDATPDAALDVGGSFTSDGNVTLGDSNTLADTLTINSSSATVGSAFGLRIATATTGGTTIAMFDGANQRLGIGTDTPSVALHVVGASTFTTNVTFGGDGVFGNAITDVVRFDGLLQLASHATPDASVTSTAVGQLILNTGATPDEVCMSTGSAAGSWVILSTPTVSCSN